MGAATPEHSALVGRIHAPANGLQAGAELETACGRQQPAGRGDPSEPLLDEPPLELVRVELHVTPADAAVEHDPAV